MSRDAKGIVVPLMTPLDEKEQVDYPALERLIDHIIDGGCQGILVLGSTSECHRFNESTREKLLRTALERIGNRAASYVGISAGGTRQALANLEQAQKLGAQYLVSTLPYYFTVPYPEEQIQFYTDLANASSRPLLLYHIPQFVGAKITVETILTLAKHRQVIGIKDSSGDRETMQTLLDLEAGPSFKVFAGKEHLASYALRHGAAGIVPSGANVFPKIYAAQYAAFESGDDAEVDRCQAMIDEINSLNNCLASSVGHFVVRKTMLEQLGICKAYYSKPIAALSAGAKEAVTALAEKYRAFA